MLKNPAFSGYVERRGVDDPSFADIALLEVMPNQTLRIIDASLNRVGEGLRLLEDIARLALDDTALTEQLKTMRHELLRGDSPFQQQLLEHRDASGDVGVDLEVPGEDRDRDLSLVLVANARRVQESLRTLEELAKVPGTTPRLDPNKFKQARFRLYTIEQELMSRLLRRDKQTSISGLYVIIDTQVLKGRNHLEVAAQVIRGGARVIQLRDKLQTREKVLPLARELKALCAEHDVLFIMNDYLDVALDSDADGLHVGRDDLPLPVARRLLPLGKILGYSVATVDQATRAQSEGADYIAASSIYPTPSKEGEEVVGLKRLSQIKEAISLPLVAIGGITRDNAYQVMAAGADSVAVISAVLGAESPQEACRQIVASLEMQK